MVHSCLFLFLRIILGVYVIVGQYTDNGSIDINPHLDINKKHLDIRYLMPLTSSYILISITGVVGVVTIRTSILPSK